MNDMESEKSILGGILLDNKSYWKVADKITAAHFTTDIHSQIWANIVIMMDNRDPVDLVTMTAKVGKGSYLGELLDFVPTAANIKSYADMLCDEHSARMTDGLLYGAIDFQGTAAERIEYLEAGIADLQQKRSSENTTIKQELPGVFKWLEYRNRNKGELIGIPTSLPKLDKEMMGFCPGNLIIIGARPSVGKTALGLQIARANGRGLLFSAEMQKPQLIQRILSAESNVSLQDMRSGYLPDGSFSKMTEAAPRLIQSGMVLNDKGAPHINYIKAVARVEHMKKPLEYVMVDYLGLITAKADSRVQEVSLVSRELKALAKELNVPLIALAQLNRNTEGRTDPRPNLADLKDSGSIEQDADDIIFLHRPSRYCQACKEQKQDCGGHQKYKDRGIDFYKTVEIILAKHRQGPLVDVKTYFEEEVQRFEEIEIRNFPEPGPMTRRHQ